MSTEPGPEPARDWIDEEAEFVLNHPEVRKRIEEIERQRAAGTLRTIPHEEAMKRFSWYRPLEPRAE